MNHEKEIALIYVASRASVPERVHNWRMMRDNGWPIISTWIDEAGPGQTEDMSELWQRIAAEINQSAGVILYAYADDFPLKGALIECGIAIGLGKRVAVRLPDVLIEPPSFRPIGSWIKHPLVRMCGSLEDARKYVETGQ